MTWSSFISNPVLTHFLTLGLGIVGSLVVARLLGRRGLVEYRVSHNSVGISTDDRSFGSLRVTWQGNALESVWTTDIEVLNASMNDYQDVVLKTFSARNTNLLTERSRIQDSVEFLRYTDDYVAQTQPVEGRDLNDAEKQMRFQQRHYQIPVLNRGQVIHLKYFTNVVHVDGMKFAPGVWVDIQHPGIRLKYKSYPVAAQAIWSVPIPHAAYAGIPIALTFAIVLASVLDNKWTIAALVFPIAVFAAAPGALAIRLYRRMRAYLAG